LYRAHGETRELQVLLVHASGNYNRRAPWGIPKGHPDGGEGLPDDGESLEDAARRETMEETGVIAGELTEIGHIDYRKSRKRVFAFAGAAPPDAAPHCASWEVDKAEFMSVADAAQRIHPEQLPFLERLAALLAAQAVAGPASIP
jgi:predicted NUDIX family NTP pyrophosphohydrolase